jgi:hypothetical protein
MGSLDHLVLYCDVAFALWSILFSHFGMFWVMPRRVIDLFACWWSVGRPRSAALWKIVPTCLFWTVWRERNNRRFEDLERSLEDIISSFFHFVPLDCGLCPLWQLVIMIFLFTFLFLVKCLLLYTTGVLRGVLRF